MCATFKIHFHSSTTCKPSLWNNFGMSFAYHFERICISRRHLHHTGLQWDIMTGWKLLHTFMEWSHERCYSLPINSDTFMLDNTLLYDENEVRVAANTEHIFRLSFSYEDHNVLLAIHVMDEKSIHSFILYSIHSNYWQTILGFFRFNHLSCYCYLRCWAARSKAFQGLVFCF